jgi:hypothetical protein
MNSIDYLIEVIDNVELQFKCIITFVFPCLIIFMM